MHAQLTQGREEKHITAKKGERKKNYGGQCLNKSRDESQETGSVEAGNERGKEAGGGGREKHVKTEQMLCVCFCPLAT